MINNFIRGCAVQDLRDMGQIKGGFMTWISTNDKEAPKDRCILVKHCFNFQGILCTDRTIVDYSKSEKGYVDLVDSDPYHQNLIKEPFEWQEIPE